MTAAVRLEALTEDYWVAVDTESGFRWNAARCARQAATGPDGRRFRVVEAVIRRGGRWVDATDVELDACPVEASAAWTWARHEHTHRAGAVRVP